jgi:hypothetical protein
LLVGKVVKARRRNFGNRTGAFFSVNVTGNLL